MNMRFLLSALFCLFLLVRFGPAAHAQDPSMFEENSDEKLAQTGMKFLGISTSPRAAALGDAVMAENLGAASMFYNPAGMARLDGFGDVAVGRTQWIADIGVNSAGIALSPAGGRFGVVGFSLVSVDYGEFEGTIRANNQSGYVDTGIFSPTAMAVGVGYAKSLTDRFAVGGNVRYVHEDLGSSIMSAEGGNRVSQSNATSTPAFDFGVLYATGFESLNLAMTARNFAPAIKYEEETFELPLLLSIGLSMDVVDLMPAAIQTNHSFRLYAGAETPRDYYEQINLGGEYEFMEILSLRAGYSFPSDEQGVSLGAGLNFSVSGFAFDADYAYTRFGALGDVNRFAFQFGF